MIPTKVSTPQNIGGRETMYACLINDSDRQPQVQVVMSVRVEGPPIESKSISVRALTQDGSEVALRSISPKELVVWSSGGSGSAYSVWQIVDGRDDVALVQVLYRDAGYSFELRDYSPG